MNSKTTNAERLVISTACLGMFLSTLDSGIVNVALPKLQSYFQTSVSGISWTITLYLLVLSSTIIAFGRLSDCYGRVKIFFIGLIVFALGSLLCGISQKLSFFIFARGFQGLGAAMLQATAVALITTMIAEKNRGSGLGTLAMIIGMGPIIGPAIGGLFISTVGWRWMFLLNLPLCLYGLFLCSQLKETIPKKTIKLDIGATLLLSFTMLSLMLFINSQNVWFGVITVMLLIILVKQQSSSLNPIISKHMFKNLYFSNAIFSTFVFGLVTATILVIPPLFLTNITKTSPWKIGLISLCCPLGLIITAKYSGKKINNFGANNLMLIGFGIMILSLLVLQKMDQLWDLFWFVPVLLLYGVGGGLFQPANISSIMRVESNDKQGTIGAFNRMIHNFGNAFGVAVSAFFLQVFPLQNIDCKGFHYSWLLSLGLMLIAFMSLILLNLRSQLNKWGFS